MIKLSYTQHRANHESQEEAHGTGGHAGAARMREGKKRASLSALKYGGTAQTIILPGEDIRHFGRFHQALVASLRPANALEASLVASLAQTQWVIDRMRAHEVSMFAIGHELIAENIDAGGDQVIQSALAGAKTVKVELESLKTTSLYLLRNAHIYEGTLRQLTSLQAARKAEEKAAFHMPMPTTRTSIA